MHETTPQVFTVTTYPRGFAPYIRWELTAPTGEVIYIGGSSPIDLQAIEDACAAWRQRVGRTDVSPGNVRVAEPAS